MLGFIKKIFGVAPAEPTPEVPYKVEAKVEQVNAQPVAALATEVAKPVAKKAPAKKAPAKATAKKAKAPRKPKAKPAVK